MSGEPTPQPGVEALLAAHYMPVMRLCLSRLRDSADAEDATQETFRRAVQNAGVLREDPLPWLLTVARNVCTDELRRRSRVAGLTTPDELPPAPGDTTPEGVVLGRLAAVELLGRLTRAERRAVAARMGALAEPPATSTTRVLLARARDKVRRYLEDAQAAVGTATVSTTEALHQLRTRLLGRTLIGSGRAAVVIPALLIIGVVGPASTPSALTPTPPRSGPSAVVPPPGDDFQARDLHLPPPRGTVAGDVERLAGGGASAGAVPASIVLPPPSGPTWMTSLPTQDDYRQVDTLDIEPSPAYASDHTVLMIGPNHCGLQLCSQIYKSTDGGATWSLVTAQEVSGQRLALPAGSFSSGGFYVTGRSGAGKTTDGGRSFSTVLPSVSGYPLLPAHAGSIDLFFSSLNALWGIRPDGSSILLSLFDGGDQANTAPYLLHEPAGDVILQPVIPAGGGAATQPLLERCTPTCGPATPLPLYSGVTTLFASPDIATDHTLYISAGSGELAVSHDDGRTFAVRTTPAIADAVVVHAPSGRRIVAAIGVTGVLEYSDDDGLTWQGAAIPASPLFDAHTITELRPGRLIASMQRGDDPGWYYFVCSTDGSAWALCSADGG